MDKPEKLSTYGTQDEEKQNKNTTQYALDTTIHKKHTNNVYKTWSLLQISGGKDKSNKLTGLLSQNRNYNSKLLPWRFCRSKDFH